MIEFKEIERPIIKLSYEHKKKMRRDKIIVNSIAFTTWAVFSLWLAWYNNFIF